MYSPQRRTALVLTGTGTAGAYHAGVLRALHEAGVKIDLVAGLGMGAASAMFAAVDGGAHLWEDNGVWRRPGVERLYGWRRLLRVAVGVLLATLAVLLAPALVLLISLLIAIMALIVRWIGLAGTADRIADAATRVDSLLGPAALPVIVPRLVTLGVMILVAVLVAGALMRMRRSPAAPGRRRVRGRWWWRALGVPLTADDAQYRMTSLLWQLIRGAAPLPQPSLAELSRRYTELLSENLGQPGFRELIVTAHDIDARCDLVAALLSDAHRPRVVPPPADGRAAAADVLDLTGTPRDHACDLLAGALRVPALTDPHLVRFTPESFWRGETHRLVGRPEALSRLLEEIRAAGAEQVLLVAAHAELTAPHSLADVRLDVRGRAGEHLAAAESASVRDAVTLLGSTFHAVFQIRPAHNPIGPFDFAGAYDERSDRVQSLAELIARGYEDAYRQFIEPVVGASGDRMAAVSRP